MVSTITILFLHVKPPWSLDDVTSHLDNSLFAITLNACPCTQKKDDMKNNTIVHKFPKIISPWIPMRSIVMHNFANERRCKLRNCRLIRGGRGIEKMPWLPSPALVVVLRYIKKDIKLESFKSVVPES